MELEFSLSAGVSVKISQFGVDLSKLVVFEDDIFMFFFGVSTLTGLSTFTADGGKFIIGLYIKRIETLSCFFVKYFMFLN